MENEIKTCPNCGLDTAIALGYDEFPCSHCNWFVKVEYCTCTECNFSFRLCDGEFFDGSNISEEELHTLAGKIEEAIADGTPLWDTPEVNLTDQIINCIRCASPRAYRETKTSYVCPDCDFSWEMLENE